MEFPIVFAVLLIVALALIWPLLNGRRQGGTYK